MCIGLGMGNMTLNKMCLGIPQKYQKKKKKEIEEFLVWYRECLIYCLMNIVSGLNLVFDYTFLFNTVNSGLKKYTR